jgi:ribose transport system substrate-binding protein
MLAYEPPKANEPYKIALLEVSLAGYYYQAMAYGAQQAADAAGVELTILGGKGYKDPSQQLNEAQDLINRGIDGLVLAPVDPKGSAAIVDTADAQGIPVVNVSSEVENDKAWKLLQDDYEQGQTSARALAELLPQGGEGIIMGGPANGEWSRLRVQGFKDELAKHPEFSVAAETNQDVDPAAGLANFESAVQAHPDPKWIYSVYAYILTPDSIPARYADVPYVTTAYEPMVIDALKNGSIDSTVANDPVAMGEMGVGMLVAALNGDDPPKGTTCLPNTPLDKADVGTPVADFELYPDGFKAGE